MRAIGLHLRIERSLHEIIDRSNKLAMPLLQCFLLDQSKMPLTIDAKTEALFKQRTTQPDTSLFIHGSYFINLAQVHIRGYQSLKKEALSAVRLGADAFILHPGAVQNVAHFKEGIKQCAATLNKLTRDIPHIQFLLENTAHGNRSIGGDLQDFKLLKQYLDQQDRINYCIDTAHAFAYGYDLNHRDTQEKFIAEIDATIGIQQVKLIHLNDSFHPCGSHIDKHALIGEGYISQASLLSFALHPLLKHIPLILELPLLSEYKENDMLRKVRTWLDY